MKMIVGEFKNTLIQDFEIPIVRQSTVAKIRPHLFIAQPNNFPIGKIRLSIYQDNIELAFSEQTFQEIRTKGSSKLQDDYYHGFITFDFDYPLNLYTGNYQLTITCSDGYTYTETDFVGWVKDADQTLSNVKEVITETTYTPYAFETYSYKAIT